MKLIVGWMIPEMNWARKLASKRPAFSSSKVAIASSW